MITGLSILPAACCTIKLIYGWNIPELSKSPLLPYHCVRNFMVQSDKDNHTVLHLGMGWQKTIYIGLILLCLTPLISAPIALITGIAVAWLSGNPFTAFTKKATSLLLKICVVGLGFGMDFTAAMKAGSEGILLTIISLTATLLLGLLLGRLLGTDSKTSYLLSSGTAICGGSAIAAVSPIIQAEQRQISVALGIVFILNAIALLVFPAVGKALDMTQHQFGLWAAIAIHDTSSVVGAATTFGSEALQVATTVKLTRALWIIPLAIATTFIYRNKKAGIAVPYFIGFFVIAMLLNTYLPFIHQVAPFLVKAARAGLNVTLFLIGSSLSTKVIAAVGVKPFIQALLLWIVISVISLAGILRFAV